MYLLLQLLSLHILYRVSHNTILDNLKENSRLLTLSTVNEVEKILSSVQKIPDNLAKIIETGNYTPGPDREVIKARSRK